MVTLVSGRQRMGPIKEMNFRTRTHTCSLSHEVTQIQHRKKVDTQVSYAAWGGESYAPGNQSERFKFPSLPFS